MKSVFESIEAYARLLSLVQVVAIVLTVAAALGLLITLTTYSAGPEGDVCDLAEFDYGNYTYTCEDVRCAGVGKKEEVTCNAKMRAPEGHLVVVRYTCTTNYGNWECEYSGVSRRRPDGTDHTR